MKKFRFIRPFKGWEKKECEWNLIQYFQCGECGEIYDERIKAVECAQKHEE